MRIPASEVHRLLNRPPKNKHVLCKEPEPPDAYVGFEEELQPQFNDADFFERMVQMRKFLQKHNKN